MLETQNRALIKIARERTERIEQLERELQHERERHQKAERELAESATKYSLWGQKLERELNRIDPDGAPKRWFGAEGEE
jgi:uncharacterized protein (DUF3084 family)